VKQNALFHGNHNEPQIRNMRERWVYLTGYVFSLQTQDLLALSES
jgi:hypothetical protein